MTAPTVYALRFVALGHLHILKLNLYVIVYATLVNKQVMYCSYMHLKYPIYTMGLVSVIDLQAATSPQYINAIAAVCQKS